MQLVKSVPVFSRNLKGDDSLAPEAEKPHKHRFQVWNTHSVRFFLIEDLGNGLSRLQSSPRFPSSLFEL